MYKAVFIDIDGTLIKSDHTVSPATKETIQKLIAKNILVVLVSARPIHGILPISEQIATLQLPIAGLNGSSISLNNEVLFDSQINLETIAKLHEEILPYNAMCIYYEPEKWFAEVWNAYTEKEQKITHVPVTILPFHEMYAQWQKEKTGPNKILIIAEADVINAIQNKLQPLYVNQLNIYTSKPIYLEVMNYNASKTNAIKFLADKYNIKREEIIAIGDNFNDKEMIEFAGTGVAMGNAPDEVKAVADFVTDTNNNDGVAKAISKFIPLV